MEKLKEKKVLVTGASGAIGAAAVRHLLASGAEVYVTGRDKEKLSVLAASSGHLSGRDEQKEAFAEHC